jgi:hypothetical protein
MGDKSLVMIFLNELGARVSITLPAVKDGVTALEVSDAMDVLIAKNVFKSTGGDLKVKHSAQITERNVTALEVR